MAARKKTTRKSSRETPTLSPVRAQVEETRAFVARYQDRVLDLLAQDETAVKRFYQTFSICIAMEPKLATCTRASLVGAMLEIAALKLEPGVLGEAWVIPFRDRRHNVVEAQVIVGYKGMLKLARNSGRVGKIDSDVVYEKDLFDWRKGTRQYLDFRKSDDEDRGKRISAWADSEIWVENARDPSRQFEVMLAREVLAIKNSAPSAKASTSPWKTDEESMWRKTVLRRLCKFLPSDPESRLTRAVGIDDLLDANRTQDLRANAADLPEIPVIEGVEPDDENAHEGGEPKENEDGDENARPQAEEANRP